MEILDKLPTMFLILGFTYIAMQIVGCLLLENPDVSDSHENSRDEFCLTVLDFWSEHEFISKRRATGS